MGMFGARLASTIGYFTSVILFLYLYYYKKDTLIILIFIILNMISLFLLKLLN